MSFESRRVGLVMSSAFILICPADEIQYAHSHCRLLGATARLRKPSLRQQLTRATFLDGVQYCEFGT